MTTLPFGKTSTALEHTSISTGRSDADRHGWLGLGSLRVLTRTGVRADVGRTSHVRDRDEVASQCGAAAPQLLSGAVCEAWSTSSYGATGCWRSGPGQRGERLRLARG